MFRRLRSDADVGSRGNGRQEDLGQVAAAKYAAFAVGLAAITALGLFFLAGLRDPWPWAGFTAAALFAIIGPRSWIARAEGATEPVSPELQPVRSSAPPKDEEALGLHSGESHSDPDEVDYLRALRHELRTPLNAVLGFSDVLLSGIDGDINPSQREDLEIIRASGIRLKLLLDSALDISQLAEGTLRLDKEEVDVRELVDRAAAEATQLWSNKREASCALPDDPCVAEADESRLRRSILVLADFLASSHRDAHIALSLEPSDDHLAIEVAAENADRLTLDALPTPAEVLSAEDVTKIRQWPVAVTSELIGRHGGSLYHGSAPSRFLIRLPIEGGEP